MNNMNNAEKIKQRFKAMKEFNEMLMKENFNLKKQIRKLEKNNKELSILLHAKMERLKR